MDIIYSLSYFLLPLQEMVIILLNISASERTISMVNGSHSIKSILNNYSGVELQRLIKVSPIRKIYFNSLSFFLPLEQEIDLLTRNLHFEMDYCLEIRKNFVKKCMEE
jgi:hypothetical protein